MKKFNLKSLIVFFGLPLMLVFNGCQKEAEMNAGNDQSSMKTEKVFSELQLPNLPLIQMPDMQESSLDFELLVKADGIPPEEDLQLKLDEKTNEFCSGCKVNIDFIKFLKNLNLTKEQKIKLDKVLKSYTSCRKDFYVQLKKTNAEIIAKGNKEREELMMQYKKGVITKEQLKKALVALNERIKNAIKESPARKKIILGLEKCHQQYLAQLKLILTKEQMEKWIKWYKTH